MTIKNNCKAHETYGDANQSNIGFTEDSTMHLACAKMLTIITNEAKLNQYTLLWTSFSFANFEYATHIIANKFTYKPPIDACASYKIFKALLSLKTLSSGCCFTQIILRLFH